MARLIFAPELKKKFKKLKKTNPQLLERVQKQINLFTTNPKHPSLRLHNLGGQLKDSWSISISGSIRMIYRDEGEETYYFFDIGTHDQVYKG